MKNFKKVLCVILSAVVAAAALCGCSKEAETDADYTTRITADAHYSETDDSAYRAYEKLCSAVIWYESTADFNTQLLDDVMQLFYTSFPLNSLAESIDVSSDNTGVEITYKNDEETHLAAVSDFYSAVDTVLDECGVGSVSVSRAVFNIYTYISSNFTVDTSVVTVSDCIIQHKGAAGTINSAFEYLVLCAGGEASHLINTSQSSIVSLAVFNSNGYFFDVGSEIEDNGGTALKYFAMDSERLAAYAPGTFSFTDGVEADSVDDTSYSDLASSVSFTAEDGENDISVNCGDNKTFTLTIV